MVTRVRSFPDSPPTALSFFFLDHSSLSFLADIKLASSVKDHFDHGRALLREIMPPSQWKKFAAAGKAPSVVFSSVSTEVQIGHVLSTYVPKHRSSTSKSPKTIRDSDSWWTRIVTEMGEVLQTINVHCALCAFIWGKCKFEYTNLVNTYKAATWASRSFLCACHRAAWGRLAT